MLGFFFRRFPVVGVLVGVALLVWGISQDSVIPGVAGVIMAAVWGVRLFGGSR